MKHRILSIIMALILCVGLYPTWALAAESVASFCKHHQEHDEACGYIPASEDGEGSPCTYECRICPVEELIAALPDAADITEDHADGVRAQLEEILALYQELTEDEQEQIDLSRCYGLQETLDKANTPMLAEVSTDYQEAAWDESNRKVTYATKTAESCTVVVSSTEAVTWTTGWYAVNGSVTISEPITVTGSVNLILTDGCSLTAEKGIVVTKDNSLTIYAQTGGTGRLNATGTSVVDENYDHYAAAGIGGSITSFDSGSITIHGGVIHATGGSTGKAGSGGAGIGGSSGSENDGSSGAVTIYGGTIIADSGEGTTTGAGIGGGGSNAGNGGSVTNITIYDGSVTATSHATSAGGAGIGGGGGSENGGNGGSDREPVTIYGGTVQATGSHLGAGIGGGGGSNNYKSGNGNVTISGGTVTAVGGNCAAGIGGGGGYQFNSSFGSTDVTGGTGTVTITGGIVDAKGGAGNEEGAYAGAPMGNGGNQSTAATVNKTTGIVFENGVGTVCGNVAFDGSYEVPSGCSLHIPAGASLSGSGTLSGGGTFTTELSENMISVPTDFYYNGQDRSNDIKTRLSAGLTQGIAICGQTFTVSGWTVEVSKTDEMTYTAAYTNTDNSSTFQKTITLQKSGTQFVGEGVVKTYKDGAECSDFTADDTITVKATPTATGQAPAKAAARLRGEPAAGQMAVYVGDTLVSNAAEAGADGSYTMTVRASDVLTNGQAGQDNTYTLIVRFVENTNMAGDQDQVEVTVTPNPLTKDMVTLSGTAAVYDGYEHKPVVTVDGLVEGTDYEITYSSQDFTNTGTVAITVTGKGNYAGTVEKIFTIEKAALRARGTGVARGTYGAKLSELTVDGDLVVHNAGSGAAVPGRWVLTGDAIPSVGDSREYTATFIPSTGAENYNPLTFQVKLEIARLDTQITVGTDTYDKTFGDAAFLLDVTDNNPEAEVQYEVTTGTDVISVEGGKVTIHAAGSGVITVSLPESANCNAAADKTITVNVGKKGGYRVETLNRSYLYSRENTDRIDLAALLPSDCGPASYGEPVVSGDVAYSTAPHLADGKLSYTQTVGNNNAEGSITVTVTTRNYADITIPIKVMLTDRIPVALKEGTEVTLAGNPLTYGESLSKLEFNHAVFVDCNGNMVEGALAWKDASARPNAGTARAVWVFTPTDQAYLSVEGTAAITVNRAVPTLSAAPTAADRTYHPSRTLKDSDLAGGKAVGVDGNQLEGAWSWQSAGYVPTVNNSGYAAVFTPKDTTNYETVTRTIPVKVEKATPYIAVNPTAAGITHGETLKDSSLSGGTVQYGNGAGQAGKGDGSTAAVTGTFTWKEPSAKPAVTDSNRTEYTVRFTPFDTANYHSVETKVKLTVHKAQNVPNTPGSSTDAPNSSGASDGPGAGTTDPGSRRSGNTGQGSGSTEGTRPEPGRPFIKGADGKNGWDVIRAEEEQAEEGSTIHVNMNGATVVPGDIFDSIKGKDITITFDMGNGILWSVDGTSITTDQAGDIDFSVKTGVNTVPVDIVNNVTGENYSIQISLAHEGEFGFTAVLSINLGKENAGYAASLYYYNESTGELEFICADEVSADGMVSLAFPHASDYVIVVDDGRQEEEGGSAEPAQPETPGGDSAGNTEESPENGEPWSLWWMVVLGLLVIAVAAGVFFLAQKNKEQEDE